MSDILGDLARNRLAFEKPTLTLLEKKWAPLVLAVFSSHFTRERARIPADQFHVQVETTLDELRMAGEDLPPHGSVRELCRSWVTAKWLSLASNDENVEEYALTSHTQSALEYVERLSGERAMFGESRIRTILDTARRCATEANPDREERLRRLEEQIAELTAERDRIADGGEIEAATDDQMLDSYLNLHGLLAALPSDFMRVSEAVKEIHRSIISDFRADERRSGEVLDDYLARAGRLMTESLEGRAFTGAVELLRDDTLLAALRRDLETILGHGFADVLTAADRTNLRRTVSGIRNGMRMVLAERHRLSGTLRTHMARHDPLRDKELDAALREVQQGLGVWMETAGPRAKVPVDLGLATVDMGHLRMRLYDPADHAPPPPLATVEPDGEALSFEEIRAQGGPTLAALSAAITARLDEVESVTIGQVFAGLPEGLRRPVEVLGLIHLAVTTHGVEEFDVGRVEFAAVRPDGSRRTFTAPELVVTRPVAGEGSA